MAGPKHVIAIIGGGFTGATLATALLRSGQAGLTIHLVEPRPEPGWGVAYGGAEPWHILNVPADRMSPWADEPLDFLEWARRHGPSLGWPQAASASPETYLPRRLFGHYVEARFRQAVELGGAELILHQDRVADVDRNGEGFCLRLESGAEVTAQSVVLATGFLAPGWPFAVSGESDRLIKDPWQNGALDGIGRDDSVLVVGSGLSMVDMIYSLTAKGHRGHVTAVSRHGLLPRIHGVSTEIPPLVEEADVAQGLVSALALFRKALRQGKADWRSAADSLRPVIDGLWRALSAQDQDRFFRHLKPFWEVHRHRMPAESADLLLDRQAKGLLSFKTLRVAKVEGGPEGVRINDELSFAHLINCTPPAAPLGKDAGKLAQALLASGLVRPDRTRGGYDIEADGTLRDASGRPIPGFLTLGPPRLGHFRETTAVPHIKPQLIEVTRLLLERAQASSTAQ